MIMRGIQFFLWLMLCGILNAQSGIHGFVKDAQSGTAMADVLVVENGRNRAVYTNQAGYFYLNGEHNQTVSLSFYYVGYQPKTIHTNNLDSILSILLHEEQLKHNAITSIANPIESTGVYRLNLNDINRLPVMGGEPDPMKAIHHLPGVLKSNALSTSYHVHGGNANQNLVLLDGIPVYNVNHLFGMQSLFNSDALSQVSLKHSGINPANGGKLSSIMQLTMREGNKDSLSFTGGISLLASRIMLDGPLSSDMQFMLSLRRTYMDPIIWLLNNSIPNKDSKIAEYYFYDVNSKLKINLSSKSYLRLSAYFGKDDLHYEEGELEGKKQRIEMDWGNQTYLLRWYHLWTKQLFSNISIAYTLYKADILLDTEKFGHTQRAPYIADRFFKIDFDYYLPNEMILDFGYHSILQNIKVAPKFGYSHIPNHILYGMISGHYLKTNFKVGMRYHSFNNIFSMFNPRASLSFNLYKSLKFEFFYDKISQPIHKLSFNNILNPGDLFYPSQKGLKPQEVEKISAGLRYVWQYSAGNWEMGLFFYSKKMWHLPDFIYNISSINAKELNANLIQGRARGNGLDIELKSRLGRWGISTNYSYLDSWHFFAERNKSRKFRPKFYKRHQFNGFFTYNLNEKWQFSATILASSGNIFNYPNQHYLIYGLEPEVGDKKTRFDYGQLNASSSKPLVKIDLAGKYSLSKHWKLNFSIYNAFVTNYPVFYEYNEFTKNYTGVNLGLVPSVGAIFSY